MTVSIAQHRNRAAAAAARRAILSSHDRFWRPTDFDLPQSTVHHLLGELAEDQELRRIRRGLYWRGIKTPLGMAPPGPAKLIGELAPGAGVGPAGLTAANALRLSTQVPRFAEYAVPGRAPSSVGAVKFVSRAGRSGRKAERLSPTEVAVLEALEDWSRVLEVEPATAMTRLQSLLRSRSARPEKLASAARTEPALARARLQNLLEAGGWGELASRVPDVDPRTARTARASMVLA